MKSKYFILTMMASLLCVLGGACNKEPAQNSGNGGDGSGVTPPVAETPAKPNAAVISVNQSAVTFCVGESFTLVAEAKNIPNAAFAWAIDGDAAEDIVSLSQTGNTATITALKMGNTKLVAFLTHENETYFKTVSVTVTEKENVSLLVSDNVGNIGFNSDGYYARLSTLSVGGATSVIPNVSVYEGNSLLAGVVFSWQSEDETVAKIDGNKIVSEGEGATFVIGTCQVKGKEHSVRIMVDVTRPTIVLDESFVIERENLSVFTVETALSGIAPDVLYNGKSVGAYDMQSKKVTLDKSKLPTYAAELGEDKQLIIQTSLANYAIPVDMYTKILKTEADFESFAGISKSAYSSNNALWDGYFVLGADIDYNGLYKSKVADLGSLWDAVGGDWSNGGLYGFRGVFDGKGHNIDGISIDNGAQMGSIFGVLHVDGIIKNLSFTNASVAANSSLVCAAGGGTVENVYVHYASVGAGAQHYEGDGVTINNYCATFFGFKEPTITASVSNCVVDVSNATFNTATAIKLIGSEYAAMKNTVLIGGSYDLQKNSNATMCFDTVIDFVEDEKAQARYQAFDGEFWSLTKGVPISKAVYAQVCEQGVEFVDSATCLVSGTSYKFPLSNNFVKLQSNNPNVVLQSGVATVAPTVTNGEEAVITATPIFDESKAITLTCTLVQVSADAFTDLTKGEMAKKTAYYDLTKKGVHFADLEDSISGEVLYYLNEDYSMATFAKDGDPAKALIAVTADGLYKFNCTSVTKVIESAEDLQYLRRDYLVQSYNHKEAYDGKIVGTFVLVDDIDCTGLVLKNSGNYWENSRGFAGTLDGRGYTISNLSVGRNGLFGALAHATIKNINFRGVHLLGNESGDNASVCLFAHRMFNTTIENVKVEFVEYAAGQSVYSSSGLLFFETSFDNLVKDVTLDISKVSGVKYLTECLYNADLPNLSEKKSTYENVTVIVADLDEIPVFAYKTGTGTPEDVQEYPEGGFIFQEAKKEEGAAQ